MNIRFKLLLAGLGSFLAYSLVMLIVWMPAQLRQAQSDFISNQDEILSAMESDLIRHLMARDYAALYSSLEYQMQQQPSWRTLSLHLANGRRLYPLSESQVISPASPTQLSIEHPIVLEERKIADLSLLADWQTVRQHALEATYRLLIFLAVIFILVTILGLILAEYLVRRPLQKLISVTQHIADGQYDVELPTPGRDEIGELTLSFQAMRDKLTRTLGALTESAKKAEQAERYQRSIVENIGEGLVSIDDKELILSANPAAAKTFGYAQQQLSGLPIGALIPDKLLRTAKRGQRNEEAPIKVLGMRADGTSFPLEVIRSRMQVEGRHITNLILRDITLREQTETALREAKEAAEAISQAKTNFLANMSHEIRTPINVVMGMARIGLRECSEAQPRENFRHILDSGQHLLGVINDILDFSKIEAGKLALECQPFQLIPVLQQTIELFAERASAKGLALIIDREDDLPVWVEGDPLRIQQILLNLLSNAIKFTHRGEVSLKVTCNEELIRFQVSDSGIGMSVEEVSRLFVPFEQADSSTTRKYGGSGLGLAISYNLAKLMGGWMDVSSQVNVGSRFALNLPLPAINKPGNKDGITPMEAGTQLTGLRILVAEDVEMNRIILEDLLGQEGAEVVFAEDGRQALERLHERGKSGFDLVLMDLQMPVMDGYEATRKILEMAPEMPVIALTAHAFKEEREKCLAVGMLDHITKPIEPDILISAIRHHISHKPV